MNRIDALELKLAARKMVEGTELSWADAIRYIRSKQPISSLLGERTDYEFALGALGLLLLCVLFGAMGLMEAYKPYDKEKNDD